MGKMRRKKKYKITERSGGGARANLKKAFKSANWALVGKLALSTVVFFTVFETAIHYEIKAIYPVYYVILLVSGGLFAILNRGFSRSLPPPESLPAEWDAEKKEAYLARLAVNKKRAKKLLIIIIPLLLTFAYDLLYLFYLEPLLHSFKKPPL